MPSPLIAVDPATPPTGRGGGAAAAGKPDPMAVLVPAAFLAVALLAGAAVLYFTDQWRRRAGRGGDSAGSLTDFRGMFDRGEITEAEYKKLRDRLAARIKKDAARPGPPPPAPPELTADDEEPGPKPDPT